MADYFLNQRQDELSESQNIFLLGQINSQIDDRVQDPFQPQYRQSLLRQLQSSSLAGVSRIHSWADAVEFVRNQIPATREDENFDGFDFGCVALDSNELQAYFDDPQYGGPPLPACLCFNSIMPYLEV